MISRRTALLVLLGVPFATMGAAQDSSFTTVIPFDFNALMSVKWELDRLGPFTISFEGQEITFTNKELWKALQPGEEK